MSEENRSNLAGRLVYLIYGVLAYLGFHAVFLYMVFFLNDGPLPHTLESDASMPPGRAIAVDLALILLFALQHAVMARPGFKRAWTRIVPAPIERSTYVLATVVVLGAAMVFWQPVSGSVFHVETPMIRVALFGIQALGWGILVYSTFLIDHFELFGLSHVWSAFRQRSLPQQTFRMPSLYRYSRHPMMLGLLLGLWSTPDMTAGRLLWAAGFTSYVWVGIRMEERDLVALLGEEYRRYQQSVPRLIPRPGFARPGSPSPR